MRYERNHKRLTLSSRNLKDLLNHTRPTQFKMKDELEAPDAAPYRLFVGAQAATAADTRATDRGRIVAVSMTKAHAMLLNQDPTTTVTINGVLIQSEPDAKHYDPVTGLECRQAALLSDHAYEFAAAEHADA